MGNIKVNFKARPNTETFWSALEGSVRRALEGL